MLVVYERMLCVLLTSAAAAVGIVAACVFMCC